MKGSEIYLQTGQLDPEDKMLLEAFNKQEWKYCDNSPHTRLQCLEIASKLKTFDGQPMTMKELLGKAEELITFINQKT